MENRRTAQKAATRRTIVVAAGREFARRGYEGTTFASIATAMGKPRSAIGYHQFPSKQHLASAVVNTQFRRWQCLAAAANDVPPGFPRLFSLLLSALVDARQSPVAAGAIRLLTEAPTTGFALRPRPRALRMYATRLVQAEIDAGRLRPGTDAIETTDLLLSASFGVFESASLGLHEVDTEQLLRDLWILLLRGLDVPNAHELVRTTPIARIPPWPADSENEFAVTTAARGPG